MNKNIIIGIILVAIILMGGIFAVSKTNKNLQVSTNNQNRVYSGSDGEYRLFADFTPTSSMMGPDGMKLPVTISENKLAFDIKHNGKFVTDLEKYLGALGHSVILSEGDLQFIHGHPVEDPSKPQTRKVNFMVDFPEAGKYKVFTQFQRSGNTSKVESGGSMMTH